MSTIETAPLIPKQASPAVDDDRFLNSLGGLSIVPEGKARDPYMEALGFLLQYQDVLPHSRGTVLQAGFMEADPAERPSARTSLTKLASFVTGHEAGLLGTKDYRPDSVATVVFDASVSERRLFTWQVTLGTANLGRQTLQLHLVRDGIVAAVRRRDRQGDIINTAQIDHEPVIEIVRKLTSSDLILASAEKLRQSKGHHETIVEEKTMQHLRKRQARPFKIYPAELSNYLKEKMKKEESKLQKMVDDTGFNPSKAEALMSEYETWWLLQGTRPLRLG